MMQRCNDVRAQERQGGRPTGSVGINSVGQKLLTRQVCVRKAACTELYSWGSDGDINRDL